MSKLILPAFALAVAIAGLGVANAQIGTSKTRLNNITAFDPVPGQLSPEEVSLALEMGRAAFARQIDVPGHPPSDYILSDAKVWRRAASEGYVICASGTYTYHPGKVELAISISTGKFKESTTNILWDQEAYNLSGCNTPGATEVKGAR